MFGNFWKWRLHGGRRYPSLAANTILCEKPNAEAIGLPSLCNDGCPRGTSGFTEGHRAFARQPPLSTGGAIVNDDSPFRDTRGRRTQWFQVI